MFCEEIFMATGSLAWLIVLRCTHSKVNANIVCSPASEITKSHWPARSNTYLQTWRVHGFIDVFRSIWILIWDSKMLIDHTASLHNHPKLRFPPQPTCGSHFFTKYNLRKIKGTLLDSKWNWNKMTSSDSCCMKFQLIPFETITVNQNASGERLIFFGDELLVWFGLVSYFTKLSAWHCDTQWVRDLRNKHLNPKVIKRSVEVGACQNVPVSDVLKLFS